MSSASTWVWSRWQNNSWLGFTYLSVEHRLVHGPFSRPLRYCRYKKKCDLFICYNTTSREIIITVWVWGFCSSTSCATMVPPPPSLFLSDGKVKDCSLQQCHTTTDCNFKVSHKIPFPCCLLYQLSFSVTHRLKSNLQLQFLYLSTKRG